MIPLVSRLLRGLTRRPGRAVAIAALLLVIGLGASAGAMHLWVWYDLRAARRALERRDYDEARDLVAACLRRRPRSGELHLLRARIARQAGAYPEAERALGAAQKYSAPKEDLSLERALLRAQQGELTHDLEAHLRDRVNRDDPESLLILEALARGYMRNYRLADARLSLDLWLQQRPDDVQALLGRGWVFERLEDFPKARDDYRRAAALAPDRPEPETRLGLVLLQLGQPEEAREVFERAWGRRPGDPVLGLGLAQSYARLGRFDEARELLDRVAAERPRDPSLLLERGNLALQQGDPADAEPWLRRAVELLPHDYQANYALWQCVNRLGKEEEARDLDAQVKRIQEDLVRMRSLTERLQSRPYDAGLRSEIGRLFLRHGEKGEGLLWLQAALRLDPGHRETHEALARHHEESGEPDLAAHHRTAAQQGRAP
jgi:Tfp pilus assembly protein PilF